MEPIVHLGVSLKFSFKTWFVQNDTKRGFRGNYLDQPGIVSKFVACTNTRVLTSDIV